MALYPATLQVDFLIQASSLKEAKKKLEEISDNITIDNVEQLDVVSTDIMRPSN